MTVRPASPTTSPGASAFPGLLAIGVAWALAAWDVLWLQSEAEHRTMLVVLPSAAFLTAIAVVAQRAPGAGRLVRTACLHAVAWGVAGLLASIAMVAAVDVGDVLLPFYLLGLACGAFAGAAFAVLRHFAPPAPAGAGRGARLGLGAGVFVWALAAGTWAVLHGLAPQLPLGLALWLAPPVLAGAAILGLLRETLLPW